MRPLLQVVAGKDFAPKEPTKTERRKVVRGWCDDVKAKIKAGELQAIDYLLAEALTNFPSADRGFCWAGQKRLADTIGRQVRSVQSAMKRFRSAGLLRVKQGAPGKTARWILCRDGRPIFGGEALKDPQNFASDPQKIAGLDPQKSADKPSKQEHPCKQEPPPRPPAADEPAAMPDDVDMASAENGETWQGGLIGEVFAPSGCDFETFWRASGQRGKVGPAIAEWNRLEPADIAAIGALILDQGSVDTGDCWASIWIKSRGWERPAHVLRAGGFARIAEGLEGLDPHPLGMTVVRGTPQWDDLVAWRREQGATERDLKFMLTQAEWRAPPGWRPTRCAP